jgi:hypothetical protein
MFKIVYDPDYGQIVPDGDTVSFIKSYVDNHSIRAKVVVGSELLLTGFRAAVANGDLDYRNVEFYYKDTLIEHTETGCLKKYPWVDMYGYFIKQLTTARRKNIVVLNGGGK